MNQNAWNSLSRALAGIVFGAAVGQAFGAEPLSRDQLRAMRPEQLREYVQKRVQEQARRPAHAKTNDVDGTPPTLSKFSLPTRIRAGDAIVGNFSATDDESGVWFVYACSSGPHGQSVCVYDDISYPVTQSSGIVQAMTEPLLEPGNYTFTYGLVEDFAGNYTYYDQAALAALGNTVVAIHNGRKFDAAPPTMLSGKILTPTLSLSATQPGTTKPAFVAMQVDTQDLGNTAIAGTQYVDASYCLLDGSQCFYMGDSHYGNHNPNDTFVLGTQPSAWVNLRAGDYHLYYVYLQDLADNYITLYSTEFGGQTDFSQIMPGTVITLTP